MHLVAVDAESSSACQSLVASGALHSTPSITACRQADCMCCQVAYISARMNVALTGRGLPGTYFEVLGLLVLHECLFIAEHPVAVVAPRGLLVLLLFPLPDHFCALASRLLSPGHWQALAR